VLNAQPSGSLVLPAGPAHPPSTAMEVLLMPTTQIVTPYQVITDRILALLEQGTVPWQQPWDSALGLPRNLFSQRSYRGINVWLLTAMGLPSPFWATFHQVKAAGGTIRKGAHGVPVVFWKVYLRRDS
jgi:antirestriction protein ArdC